MSDTNSGILPPAILVVSNLSFVIEPTAQVCCVLVCAAVTDRVWAPPPALLQVSIADRQAQQYNL